MVEWLYKVAKSGSPLSPFAVQHLRGTLQELTSKSPQWLKFLDDIAKDERSYFDLGACMQMGNAYWSFARREDALDWYKKVGLSQQRLEEIELKPLPFVNGSIEGKILINDKTVPGIKVGVHKGIVRASTETDSEGVFRLEHLIEGEYRLAIMADEKLIPSDVKKIKVINVPDKITLDAQNPAVDLGEINIIVNK